MRSASIPLDMHRRILSFLLLAATSFLIANAWLVSRGLLVY